MVKGNGPAQTISHRQRIFVDWSIDILLYIVILNFYVEYVPGVQIDRFTISVFTAAVLKILVVVLGRFETRIHEFFSSRGMKVIGGTLILTVLFFSKFLILEIINWIFGNHVTIRGFIPLATMIIIMIVSRRLLDSIYQRLK